MNIVIISVYPPDPAPEANHALHISERLAKSGHTVHVICKKGSICLTLPNIVVHAVIEEWTWWNVFKLTGELRQCQPDVVLLIYIGWIYRHHPMITFLPTICKTALPGVPVVTQFEAVDDDPLTRSLISRLVRKLIAVWAGGKDIHWLFGTLLRDSARLIALSSPHRERLTCQLPSASDRITILPPPPLIQLCSDPPNTARRKARMAVGATDHDFVLVYWGYIYPGKGIETLLEAFRIVCTRRPNMRLLLVGGCLEIPTRAEACKRYYEMVRTLPETYGISAKVTWTGNFSWESDEGSLYLHGADACVLPFDYGVTLNNSSLAAAATHSLPVIATELPSGRDESLEHGRNIYLCRPKDPEGLAEAIELISGSGAFREQLRAGSGALTRQWYSWERTGERLISILNEALVSIPKPRTDDQARPVQTTHTTVNGSHDTGPPRPLELSNGSIETRGEPLVSVIVAAYNIEEYLRHCLDSLVHQTLVDIEVLVINDASTDNTSRIAHEYAARHHCIRVFDCGSNKGLASVRNIGLKNARGQYVAFTDGDDWADVRMCEVLYKRAAADDLDVLVADATVFYEASKTFGEHFDKHIRQSLDPRLRTRPFQVSHEPRALLLEPVAWTKFYKRSFLEEHHICFEEGMNSYEDMVFHFWVLLKAKRIALIDQAFLFYRQNRPGQISGRTNRKIFEVFAVFRKIHDNLSAWKVSAAVWAMLVKVQLRQFDWLLKDRVRPADQREFMSAVAEAFRRIPHEGIREAARYTNAHERMVLFCMQRNNVRMYRSVLRHRWPIHPLVDVLVNQGGPGVLKRSVRRGLATLQQHTITYSRSVIARAMNVKHLEATLHTVEGKLDHLIESREASSVEAQPLTEAFTLGAETLFFSYPSYRAGLGDAVWRTQHDYYLTRLAAFRQGDVVIDVGAHVGVLSIALAKTYPFLTIYALEPDELNFTSLKQNIERNGTRNVIALNMAISGDGNPRTLYTSVRESSWATTEAVMVPAQRVVRSQLVETITLESLFAKFAIPRCRLLKMTALGATYPALTTFPRQGAIDLVCGEIDLRECSKAKIEIVSWQIARQHFWRTVTRSPQGDRHAWLHELPRAAEEPVHTRTGLAFSPLCTVQR